MDHLVAIPSIALSVRQPWAWAIFHAVPVKDIENRNWKVDDRNNMRRGRIAIQAAKGLTQDEYEDASRYMKRIGVTCPPPAELQRGGIIGAVEIVDNVQTHASPWRDRKFWRGLVLRNPQPCAFVAAVGALGFFTWKPGDPAIVPEPARWMLPKTPPDAPTPTNQFNLF